MNLNTRLSSELASAVGNLRLFVKEKNICTPFEKSVRSREACEASTNDDNLSGRHDKSKRWVRLRKEVDPGHLAICTMRPGSVACEFPPALVKTAQSNSGHDSRLGCGNVR